MSYDDDQFDDQQSGPKALRDELAKVKKLLADAQAENAKLSVNVKTVTLENLMRDKNIPPKIQRWIKRDEVDPSPEAVDKWLAENGEDFGYKPGQAQTDSASTPEGEQSTSTEAPAATAVQSVLSAEDIAALERIQGLLGGATGQTVLSDQVNTVVSAVESNLGADASYEDVVKELKAQGLDIESNRG